MRFFKKRVEEEEMEDLACRFARFWYECDPYEFRDNMETGETIDEAIERTADYVYNRMAEGNFDLLVGLLVDAAKTDIPGMEGERVSLLRDVNYMRLKYAPVTSKNILEPIRRKKR